jgi:2-amino-4-hydroxy-6-hydroxymethyldihydropteridine diphosphokinase
MEKVRLNRVLLSLGSNLGDKIEHLENAIEAISVSIGAVEFISTFHESEPWGYQSKNQFVNICLTCYTKLTPFELLKILKEIEVTMGRTKTIASYEDRCIDIDIIFYNHEEIESEELTIPHPQFKNRPFVLIPIQEIIKKYDSFYHFINS